MKTKNALVLLIAALTATVTNGDTFGTGANQFTMDFVEIGYPTNVADSTGYGSVGYTYRIGMNEVTVDQFEKACAADTTICDNNENYWNDGTRTGGTNVPASYMSWDEAAKFCNWLTSADSTQGAYSISNGIVNAVDRAAALSTFNTVYVIPSEDEWHKAAYLMPDGSAYSDYANGTPMPPAGGNHPTPEANYKLGIHYVNPAPDYVWSVGSGLAEQNGTYDMMGNVFEWTESAYDGNLDDFSEVIVCRGGSYYYDSTRFISSYRSYGGRAWAESSQIGLRVAAIGIIPGLEPGPNIALSNLTVEQREGTKLVDIFFDMTSDSIHEATISLTVTNGVTAVVASSLSGDVGSGVSTGTLKHIVWDAGADWGGSVSNLTFLLSVPGGSGSLAPPATLSKTGQQASFQIGDDADYGNGVAWPSPRFTDTGLGSVIDNLTGLEWVKHPSALSGNSSDKDWTNAVYFCSGLNFANNDDWRLPSYRELMSLLDLSEKEPPLPIGHPFQGLDNALYWTSSTHGAFPQYYAWRMQMYAGIMTYGYRSSLNRVWPVRGVSTAAFPSPVPATGQVVSYLPGDDGDLQTGVQWPSPRYIDNGDGTVLDALTGLEWAKEPHALAGNSGTMNWSNALVFCESLSHGSNSDWRLPNMKELESLIHWGVDEPSVWFNGTNSPFVGIINQKYWASTTLAYSPTLAWTANLYFINPYTYPFEKTQVHYVWPVRNGQIPANADNEQEQSVNVDTREYSLTVSSPFGAPVPGTGIHSNYCWKSTVTASVNGVAMVGGTNLSCSGWIGSGVTPSLGSGTNITVQLMNPNSSIDWKWIEDLDLDRIPGDWELLYFGSETGAVATADTDGDGYNAWQEYILGSNPTNSGSSFLFTPSPTQPTNTAFSVDFTTVPGRLYTVECTDELGSGNWQVLTNFIGDGSTIQIIDPANIPACFYQIRIDWAE
jgi:formylglycine-generating enzyme required for sulfatase activity